MKTRLQSILAACLALAATLLLTATARATVFYGVSNQSTLDTRTGQFALPPGDVPKAIADNATTTSTLAASGLIGTIADVNVTLDRTHPATDELTLTMVSPKGTRVKLIAKAGGSRAKFTATGLDDEAATAIGSGATPFTGSFRPTESLAALDGQNPNGAWTLEILDDATTHTGTLNSWSLSFDLSQPAAIATHPASIPITSGATTTLTVTASGTAPFTYQWYQGAAGTTTTPVGVNSASFTTPVLTATTSYWVKASNAANPIGVNSNTAAITVTAPAIAVEQPLGSNIIDGGSKDFGVVAVGSSTGLSFAIKNTGDADLTGLTITKDGTDDADFAVTAKPVAPVNGPNATTSFTVTFTPGAGGSRTAALHLASNDADENPFDITLTGTGVAVAALDFVSVGNPGNLADPATGGFFGAVAYDYKMAKNETTIGQYCEFLNAVAKSDPYNLYNPNMASVTYIAGISRAGGPGSFSYAVIGGTANKPITFVSWFDAARFCNWLHNGKGNGSTETGAYTLNGALTGVFTKNADATAWIPSEDEWYKAAYYDPAKNPGAGGFRAIPNRSDASPGNTIGVAGATNYYDGDYVGYPNMALSDVGAYGANSASFYGTNDQGGNVYEWNDTVEGDLVRGIRGGAWNNSGTLDLESSRRYADVPTAENAVYGFRVARIDESSALIVTFGLPGNPAVVDQSALTVTLTVPYGTNVTDLAPLFTLAPGATCDRVSGATYDFTQPVIFTVTSSDYTATKAYSVAVTHAPPPPAPEIVVEEPAASGLATGDGRDFGNTLVGAKSAAKTLVVRNTGSAALQNLQLTVAGAAARDFAADPTAFPASLAPGASASVPVVTTQPLAAQTVAANAIVTLTAAASGYPAPAFQWYQGASGDTLSPVAGATAETFITPALNASTSYGVRANNAYGHDDSAAAVITVELPPSANPNLAELEPLFGVLSPAFDPAIVTYQVNLPNEVTENTLTPTVAEAGAKVTLNGQAVVSGTPEEPIPLAVGNTVATLLVAAADGVTSKTYVVTFTRAAPVVVKAEPAEVTGGTVATLKGSVTPHGVVSGYFEYGLTTAYGTKTAAEEFSGAIPVAFKARLEGLAGATVYHYRLVAVGATGSVFGADVAFTTAAEAPLAATGMPKDVTTSTATFQGAVDPKVLATQLHFEYGFTTAYGRSTSAETVAAGAGYGEVTTPVADLIPNVTYHCRIVATNAVGTTAGEDVAFVSAAGGPPGGIITLPVVTTGAVARVSTTSAILLGEVDPKMAPPWRGLSLALPRATVGPRRIKAWATATLRWRCRCRRTVRPLGGQRQHPARAGSRQPSG